MRLHPRLSYHLGTHTRAHTHTLTLPCRPDWPTKTYRPSSTWGAPRAARSQKVLRLLVARPLKTTQIVRESWTPIKLQAKRKTRMSKQMWKQMRSVEGAKAQHNQVTNFPPHTHPHTHVRVENHCTSSGKLSLKRRRIKHSAIVAHSTRREKERNQEDNRKE